MKITDKCQSISTVIESNGVLICPKCGGGYLHQESLEAVWREEDCAGLSVGVGLKGLMARQISGEEIPGRRNVIQISFFCEFCDEDPVQILQIRQHKGQTFVNWI